MASKHLLFLVILSLISSSLQDVTDNKVDSKDESPLADVAKEILKEKNLENVGGLVNSFIQSGGGKQILDSVIANLATGENSGQLLESLGNLLNSGDDGGAKDERATKKTGKKSNDDVNPMELLSGIGSLVGALQGAGGGAGGDSGALLQGLGSLLGGANNQGGGNNAAALLQGLGSLLGSASQGKSKKQEGDNTGGDLLQGLGSMIGAAVANGVGGNDNAGGLLQGLGSLLGGGEGGQGGINPEMIGNVINMFANSQSDEKKKAKPSRSKKASSEKTKTVKTDHPKKKDDSFDFGNIINLAKIFLNPGGSGEDKASSGSSFMNYLPMVMNTINAFTGPEAQERAESHSDHSWTLPPVLERIHVYYDNFINSDLGKYMFGFIGEQQSFKVFRDEKGNFSYDKFEELIENHSFRRHWIQQLAEKLVNLLQVVSDEKTYKQSFEMAITFTNSLLKKSGFPKEAFIDTKHPAKSLTKFANHAAKKYLEYDMDTREYVEPTVLYVQGLLKMAQKSISPGAQPKELRDKLTDTINMEIIEPITRVNRAYRFAKSQPKCDRYVFCLVNQQVTNYSEKLPGLKKALYKGSSLIAGWFLSSSTGTSYWDLYAVVTEDKKCHIFHSEVCNGFHEEEVKATTEYVHNEL